MRPLYFRLVEGGYEVISLCQTLVNKHRPPTANMAIGMIRSLPIFILCVLALANDCSAKDKHPLCDSATSRKMTLARFLSKVAAANLDYAAQRYNVSIARAQIAAAKVSPNPTVSFGYTTADRSQPSTYIGGVSQTIEMGGKRSDRIAVAERSYLTAAATLDDFFRTLRASKPLS